MAHKITLATFGGRVGHCVYVDVRAWFQRAACYGHPGVSVRRIVRIHDSRASGEWPLTSGFLGGIQGEFSNFESLNLKAVV